jgi:hypothetical protein
MSTRNEICKCNHPKKPITREDYLEYKQLVKEIAHESELNRQLKMEILKLYGEQLLYKILFEDIEMMCAKRR